MNLSKFIDKLTDDKIENRIDFNQITDDEFNVFIKEFDKLNNRDKEFFLLKIIEAVEEDLLVEGNYEKWFSDEKILLVLRNSL